MSEINKLWEGFDWLKNANRLINWIGTQEDNYPSILVIRHSHRNDSKDPNELSKMCLTDLGHQLAYCFGEKLPSNRKVVISNSGHPRCQETASEIYKGYTKNHGEVRLISTTQVNLIPHGERNRIGHEMIKLGGLEFIRQWIEGVISSKIIIPIKDFRDSFLKETLVRLREVAVNTLHIHVTHDLHIMTLRQILFNTELSYDNWIPFLGGFGIIEKNHTLSGFDAGRELIIDDERIIELLTMKKDTPP